MTGRRALRAVRRCDDALYQLEGLVVTFLLLAMIGVAAGQALWFNLAERGVGWAARLLEASAWADPFLQKGTLWLAFLGASLATHDGKHLAIDLVTKLGSARTARAMLRVGALGAGVVSLALAVVFFHASVASDATVPFEYERLSADGRQHVCDVQAAPGSELPQALCALRAALAALGVPIATFAGAAQLIVPLMLVVIGLRLLGRAAGALGAEPGAGGEPDISLKVGTSS